LKEKVEINTSKEKKTTTTKR